MTNARPLSLGENARRWRQPWNQVLPSPKSPGEELWSTPQPGPHPHPSFLLLVISRNGALRPPLPPHILGTGHNAGSGAQEPKPTRVSKVAELPARPGPLQDRYLP